MEEKSDKCQQNVSEQVQTLKVSREEERKSERYLRIYNNLVKKGKLEEADAREQAEKIDRELDHQNKSLIYEEYYLFLRVMRKLDAERSMLQAEAFEKEFNLSGNAKKADYYANIMASHDLKAMRLEKLEKEIRTSNLFNKDDIFMQRALSIAKDEIESGRSYFYVKKYIELDDEPETGEEVARTIAEIVDKEMKEGKGYRHASVYATLISNYVPDYKARKVAELVDNEEMSGRGCNYISKYGNLIIKDCPEDIARKRAELFEKILIEGRKHDYAEIVSREIKDGRNYGYAIKYAESILEEGMPDREARIRAEALEKVMKTGKSYYYAEKYSEMILAGESEEVAAREAEAYYKDKKDRGYCFD